MDVRDILPAPTEHQKAFILDHGKITDDGSLKYKDDMLSYEWNIRHFNQLHPGAYILNRHSAKVTKDKRFEIYSGGYVESISDPDKDGNVVAVITHAFTLTPPIRQGSKFLENFQWVSKKKRPESWQHFWNQYVMNAISMIDFWNLVNGQNCVPFDISSEKIEVDLTVEEVQKLKKSTLDTSGFIVTMVEKGLSHKKNDLKFSGIAKKIDFEMVQKSKNKIGKMGELIVLDMLVKEAKEVGLQMPIHASVVEGDGLGYDICTWDKKGNEIHIEVKSTKGKYADGFDISANEIEASHDLGIIYKDLSNLRFKS